MDAESAQHLVRTVRMLRTSLLVVLKHVDELGAFIEGAHAVVHDRGQTPFAREQAADLLIDPSTLAVRWKGRVCPLGYTVPFRLLEHLAKYPDQYVSVERLLVQIWAGARSGSTVRSAVCDLRTKLSAGGMADLARLIDGSNAIPCTGRSVHDTRRSVPRTLRRGPCTGLTARCTSPTTPRTRWDAA